MAFEVAAVSAYIAGFVISGKNSAGSATAVTVLDYGTLLETADHRRCPILQPDIAQPITMESFERDSFGSGLTAKQTLVYTLPYQLLFEPAGSTRGLVDIMPNMIYTLSRIVSSIIAHDTPGDLLVDLQIATTTLGGTVSDAAGSPYHGASLTMRVREFVDSL